MSKQKTSIFGKIVACIVALLLLGVAGVSTYCLFDADFRKQVEQKLHIESSESSNESASNNQSSDNEKYLQEIEQKERKSS